MNYFYKQIVFLSIYMAAVSNVSPTESITFTFRSEQEMTEALLPYTAKQLEEQSQKSEGAPSLLFQCDPDLELSSETPLRRQSFGNLLKHEVFEGKTLSVYCPEIPRVPHHLTIAFNRGEEVQGIADVTAEENQELFETIRKITQIYRTISIEGFVIAQFDKPQEGHLGRYVIEIIPHLPGFHEVKNIVDKVFCNLHVLFRKANLSHPIRSNDMQDYSSFWQEAFHKDLPPLSDEQLTHMPPHTRFEAYLEDANFILKRHLTELLQDKGAIASEEIPKDEIRIPSELSEALPKEIAQCFFCKPDIIEKQLVYEYKSVVVLYNIRKQAAPGCAFLILPKKHIEKVYSLSEEEIQDIHVMRKALTEALKEFYPDHQTTVYVQDGSSVGQTVLHTHEQVISAHPERVALTWTIQSLYPHGNVSDEEMREIRKRFNALLDSKINESLQQESA